MVIQISVFKIRAHLITVNYLIDSFFENVDVLNQNRTSIVFQLFKRIY